MKTLKLTMTLAALFCAALLFAAPKMQDKLILPEKIYAVPGIEPIFTMPTFSVPSILPTIPLNSCAKRAITMPRDGTLLRKKVKKVLMMLPCVSGMMMALLQKQKVSLL